MAGTTGTPRKRALEIGTDKSKFPDDVPYDNVAGVPQSESGGPYSDTVEPQKPGPGVPDPQPFSNLRDR